MSKALKAPRTRKCRKCGKRKLFQQFARARACLWGRGWTCHVCAYNRPSFRRAHARYVSNNRTRILERDRARRNKLRNDPETYAALREYQRLASRKHYAKYRAIYRQRAFLRNSLESTKKSKRVWMNKQITGVTNYYVESVLLRRKVNTTPPPLLRLVRAKLLMNRSL